MSLTGEGEGLIKLPFAMTNQPFVTLSGGRGYEISIIVIIITNGLTE